MSLKFSIKCLFELIHILLHISFSISITSFVFILQLSSQVLKFQIEIFEVLMCTDSAKF